MKCIIVDDEAPARRELSYLINSHEHFEVIGEYSNAQEALLKCSELKIDICFLDVHMPLIDGITLAKLLKQSHAPEIVFVSAHKDYAVNAFDLRAYDYILKPFTEERLLSTLDRFIAEREPIEHLNRLTVDHNGKYHVIHVNDILFAMAHERETQVTTAEATFTLHSSFTDLISKLPTHFFRCHRAYVINMESVAEVVPWFNHTLMVKLTRSKEEVPVSRTYVKAFKKKIGMI